MTRTLYIVRHLWRGTIQAENRVYSEALARSIAKETRDMPEWMEVEDDMRVIERVNGEEKILEAWSCDGKSWTCDVW